MKHKFKNITEFRKWLKENPIPKGQLIHINEVSFAFSATGLITCFQNKQQCYTWTNKEQITHWIQQQIKSLKNEN